MAEAKWEGLEFYRCTMCHRIVSMWDLRDHHKCPYCSNVYVKPTNLTAWEKVKQLVKHPKWWEWKHVRIS